MRFDEWNADLGVVVAFGCCRNWSGTALPWAPSTCMDPCFRTPWRGPHPLGCLNGETMTGASTFLLRHEIDTGHVLGTVQVPIGEDDTTGIVHDRLLEAGKHLLADTVDALADGTATPV